ncbi:MAG: abortive phage infection protein [Erysipelotrichaceae bacterium]|nr:abortive phage infection protein [Erysipelotrichaceae bacterium]
MTKYETLKELSLNHNGYLLTKEVEKAEISRPYMQRFVEENRYEKVAQGVYISSDTLPDQMYILQLLNKSAVYTGESALYLHGLMDHEPKQMMVAVKRGYNASHLKKKGVRSYYLKEELFNEGIDEADTVYGNRVRVFDIDRTICDAIVHKDEMDIQTYSNAIRSYMSRSDKNIHKLMKYARQLGIEKKVRDYTEVML